MSPLTPYCLVPASFIPMGTAVSSDMLKLGSMGGDPLDLTQTPPPTSSVLLQKTLELFEPWFPFWGETLSSPCLSHRLVIESKHRHSPSICPSTHTTLSFWAKDIPPVDPSGLETSTSEGPSPQSQVRARALSLSLPILSAGHTVRPSVLTCFSAHSQANRSHLFLKQWLGMEVKVQISFTHLWPDSEV